MKGAGIYTWFGYTRPFEERLAAIKSAGFDTVCSFWGREMEPIDGKLEEQPEKAEKAGLFLEHSHLPYYGCDAMWIPGIRRDELAKIYLSGVDAAASAGLKTLVIHPCEVYVPDMELYPNVYVFMRSIAEHCEKKGIRLAIENLGEKTAVRKLIDDLSDIPAVGLCFDSGHNNIVNGEDLSLLTDYADRIFALHVHDNDGKKDMHVLPYSEGCTVDWKNFIHTMEKTSFTGSLMLEAGYPIDYDSLDTPDGAMPEDPSCPMEDWLRDAVRACGRIYKETV